MSKRAVAVNKRVALLVDAKHNESYLGAVIGVVTAVLVFERVYSFLQPYLR